MSLPAPLRYAPDVEVMQPGEKETINDVIKAFDIVLETTSKDYQHAVRAVHAKAHGILEGTLEIAAGLSPDLAQGLFARPGAHKCYVRLSTNAGDILTDAISLPRGMAIKVLDVAGERLPGADGETQDFVLVNGPAFQAKNTKQFLGNLKLIARTTDKAEGAKVALSSILRGVNKVLTSVGIESSTVQALGGAPNADPLGETYYSVTPFRYGERIAKFIVRPRSSSLRALTGREIDASDDRDAIRHTVQAEMQDTDAVWDFCVQLCRDLEKQPVEDPTVEWKEDDSPFETVATLTVAHQDSWDAARVQAVDEKMRFGVWTGLAAHQPLGNINRARREPYLHSAEFRQRYNRCPIHEPAS